MPGETESVAIDRAVEFEEHGKDFYEKAMNAAQNESTRDIFKKLVDDEKEHLQWLQKVQDKLRRTGQLPEEDTIDVDRNFEMYFQEAKEKVDFNSRFTANEMEALEFAINLEKKGIKMYQELRDKAESLNEKALYETLATWEENHKKQLEDIYAYYEENNLLPAE